MIAVSEEVGTRELVVTYFSVNSAKTYTISIAGWNSTLRKVSETMPYPFGTHYSPVPKHIVDLSHKISEDLKDETHD